MTRFGLDILLTDFPSELRGKRLGIVCHAASIASDYQHIVNLLAQTPQCTLGAIFGPQHGLFGQTQDNMIEWEGSVHPELKVPVYSLYGEVRTPSDSMLEGLDAFLFDIQDVGARPYTYVWTLKNCMEACAQKGIPVWVLDRPNPIGCLGMDGPMLSEEFFSFVGGATMPLCHRMTMGEMALLIKKLYVGDCDLNIVWMENWWRDSLWSETGLPWVLPSPNMPTLDTAVVYPGQVLLEATNLSEGRGTTRPFELFGAPYLKVTEVVSMLQKENVPGCLFREHGFIPTFQKWKGEFCAGLQIHITDARTFRPVQTSVALLSAILKTASDEFQFKDPPYEYEYEKMPFDILAGDTRLRDALVSGVPVEEIRGEWEKEYAVWSELFSAVSHYPEKRL
ncbi:MAG: exo-beta-N-acetylmuramidase NamZ domain-containing protein [Chitinispirillaceae bacterium]